MTGGLLINHDKDYVSKPVENVKPFPPLAVEIIREILELSGRFSLSTSASLLRVCKEVQKWITPILYNRVLLEKNKQVVTFNRTVTTSTLGSNVRTLVILIRDGYDRTIDLESEVEGILSSCPQLEVLADNDFMWHVRSDSFNPHYPAPWQLIMVLDSLSLVIEHPLLRNLTHLHITYLNFYTELEEDTANDDDIYIVLSITTLTHVACSCHDHGSPPAGTGLFVNAMKHILKLPLLRMLLILGSLEVHPDRLVGPTWRALAEIEDERIFALYDSGDLDPYFEILEPGGTLWDGADVKYKDWRSRVEDTAEEQD